MEMFSRYDGRGAEHAQSAEREAAVQFALQEQIEVKVEVKIAL